MLLLKEGEGMLGRDTRGSVWRQNWGSKPVPPDPRVVLSSLSLWGTSKAAIRDQMPAVAGMLSQDADFQCWGQGWPTRPWSLYRILGPGWSAFSPHGGEASRQTELKAGRWLPPASPRPPVTVLSALGTMCTWCFNPHKSPEEGNITGPIKQGGD